MTGEGITNNRIFQFNQIIVNNYGDARSAEAVRGSLNLFRSLDDRVDFGASRGDYSFRDRGSIPSPDIRQSGAPAGQGLRLGADGFPEGTVQDAAGWKVYYEGNASVKIYAPDQKFGDTPWTHIHGDPHVTTIQDAKSGKSISYDFTKDSNFQIPSGTKLFFDTDYDAAKGNGQSITRRVVMTNGADRMEVDDVAAGKPTFRQTQDAYEWNALHITNPRANESSKYGQSENDHDTFHGAGDNDHAHWVRERDGQIDGLVTGTVRRDANGHQIYDQTVDPTLNPTTARELRPPIGSRAWGNQIRSQLNDTQAKYSRELFGQDIGALAALQTSYGIHADHIRGERRADELDWMFGGLPGYFNAYNSRPFNALYDMIELLRSDSDWRTQFRTQRQNDIVW